MKFLDPKNEFAFNQIFGNERRKDILISFLNNILQNDEDHLITDLFLLNPYQAPYIPGSKGSILDVRCHDQSGGEYVVKIQVVHHQFFDKRILSYTSRAYAEQFDQVEKYYELTPVIFLGILTFQFTENTDYTSTHKIYDLQTHECIIKDIQFTFVELPKFLKKENELETIADKWIYFLKHATELDAIPEVIHEEVLKEAFNVVDHLDWSKEELEFYSYSTRATVDEKMRVLYGFEKGKAEGFKEGLAIVREEQKSKIALRMLEERLDKKMISQVTGFSSEDLERIRLS